MNLVSTMAARFFALSLLVSAVSSPIFASPVKDASVPLRVGIMTDADSMPIMLARDEGLFEKEGVAVELMVFSNPQERDAALQAGKIDGAVSDLLAAAFFTAGGFDVKITSLTDGRYGIAASSSSGVASIADLQGKKIGLSTNTIIQYTVDAQLKKAGIPSDSYEPVSIPRMPVRMEMLLNGQIDAASLPEPLLAAAVAQGATLLSTTDTIGVDAGIMLFLTKTLDTRLEDIQKFYRAYTAAAQRINADPDAYREYLVEKASFPLAVKDAYQFVRYRSPALPDEAQIEQAFAWLKERNLLSIDLKASDLIDGRGIN
ncbi:MAG: ABC transporter substrate-binding protein [Treponema sp.]|jgi:NitT/TauT family transport system substrate-binding protein|nr:ABC transporter substrate-binding protein [Treponema sp.]